MHKHNQLDQEPTPIDCLFFKELANQPLGRFATPPKQRRGVLYRRHPYSQHFFEITALSKITTLGKHLFLLTIDRVINRKLAAVKSRIFSTIVRGSFT
jgi:hypothetical protein